MSCEECRRTLRRLLTGLCLLTVLSRLASGENWPRFRGENGSGISEQKGIPVTWTDEDYAWKVELAHVGHSAPIVWDKHLFVTSATEGGGERFLHCFHADTGELRWEVSAKLGESRKHLKNSWASSTPATDGHRVYLMLADSEKLLVKAWNFDGQEVWTRDLGSYESEHNLGVSPIVQDGLLIVPNDQVGPSSLLALRPESGETVWIAERPPGKTSYSTPVIAPGDGSSLQILCISESSGITSTDLKTGRLNWQTPRLPMRTVSSPIVSDGLVFATCGEGGNGKYFAAARIDAGAGESERIVYERRTMLPYVPCLTAKDGLLYLWGDKGIMVCLDIYTGREVWTQRIDGQFSGSPICIEDRLYCVTEDGIVVVLSTGPEFRELGRTPLGDDCHSTPAVANGHLYLRTFRRLYALRAK